MTSDNSLSVMIKYHSEFAKTISGKTEITKYINAALNILYKGNASIQSIVGRERAEITNACRELDTSLMKQEVSQPSKVS